MASNFDEFKDTLENIPEMNEGAEPEKTICYAVAKSDRNNFALKIMIGRARNNDIVLRSQSISKVHAALTQDERDDWQIILSWKETLTKTHEFPNLISIIRLGKFSISCKAW